MNFVVALSIILLLQKCQCLAPVILIPGDGGSQLHAKLNRSSSLHYYCEKQTDKYFPIWLNLELLVPFVIKCWIDNMKLIYNNETRKAENTPGVDIKALGFGGTETVDWLDVSEASPSRYFVDLSNILVSMGMKRNVSIRGAPYDFRHSPNEFEDILVKLKMMIEDTYRQNNNKKLVLVAHSMGCPTTLYFLKKQSLAWRRKYIKALVTLSGVYGGAVKSMRVFASGDNLSTYVLYPLQLREVQRSFSSLAFLLPSLNFWNSSEVLVQTLNRNYTVADYKQYFTDLKFMDGYSMWQDSKDLISDLTPPGVDVHCLHGVSVKTEEKIIYKKKGFPDYQPQIIYGDGDGTVNVRSLEGCLHWKNTSSYKIYHRTYSGIDHMNILRHEPALVYIKELIESDSN